MSLLGSYSASTILERFKLLLEPGPLPWSFGTFPPSTAFSKLRSKALSGANFAIELSKFFAFTFSKSILLSEGADDDPSGS